MVYRLLGWDMMDGVYHKIQIISCASAKITLIIELVCMLKIS